MIRKLRDLAIMALLSVLALVAVELMVRWLAPQDKTTVHLGQGTLGKRDADTGHLLTPGVHTRTTTSEFTVEYQINEDGWRDAATYPPEPPPGRTRILLLGDSFAYGEATNYEEIWPVRLEKHWRDQGHDVEIIKAGVPGFDTRKEAKLLERLMPRYRPHGVLVAFVANDLFTNKPLVREPAPVSPPTETTPAEPENATEGEAVAADVITVEHERKRQRNLHVVRWLQRLAIQSDSVYRTVYERTGRARYFTVPLEPSVERSLEVTTELFDHMASTAGDQNISLAVISLPQLYQVLSLADGPSDGIDPGHIDATMTERLDMPWVPLADRLAERYVETGTDLYHRYDGHFTVEGNRATAQLLGDLLTPWLETLEP